MAWLAVDEDNDELVYQFEPWRGVCTWKGENFIRLPKGSIKKLIGRNLTWEDDPVELK